MRGVNNEVKVQFLKFIGVGILNTLISLAVIYLMMKVGVNYKLSNLTGYIVGVINSFVWNKAWVFGSKNNILREIFLFAICFALCYGLQYVLLLLMVETWDWNKYLSQLFAMGAYTVANFILNRLITFRKREPVGLQQKQQH